MAYAHYIRHFDYTLQPYAQIYIRQISPQRNNDDLRRRISSDKRDKVLITQRATFRRRNVALIWRRIVLLHYNTLQEKPI